MEYFGYVTYMKKKKTKDEILFKNLIYERVLIDTIERFVW
jgi:hypothetical protein